MPLKSGKLLRPSLTRPPGSKHESSRHRRRRIHRLPSLRAPAGATAHHVICLDNFFTGRRENVEHLLDHPEFELIRHDVIEPIFIDVDQIYNLACPASPIHYQYNPVKTVKSNVMGAINMLVLAKRVARARCSRRPPPRCTAIRPSIRSPRATGAT